MQAQGSIYPLFASRVPPQTRTTRMGRITLPRSHPSQGRFPPYVFRASNPIQVLMWMSTAIWICLSAVVANWANWESETKRARGTGACAIENVVDHARMPWVTGRCPWLTLTHARASAILIGRAIGRTSTGRSTQGMIRPPYLALNV